ncbi:TPD1 protein homolog 1 isoform X1 [Ricinus communis]|uniref:TPD1 protein homolog 1 isoform X1 n=1 Tax=Ricinus communis TaxID=3988 RepID=UPI00201AFCA8|nr:TPD1 protein homolog 1 isoform X1 [Ricinus communis]
MRSPLLRSFDKRVVCIFSVVGTIIGSLLASFCVADLFQAEATAISESGIQSIVISKDIRNTASCRSRKLLQYNDNGDGNRIGTSCSKDDIVIYQGSITPLPDGVPSYTVQVLNICDCSISNIHVSCGWFSSVRLINPRIFRRIFFDDCLVNDGEALGPGEAISFQYANSFRYPLSVISVSCC